MVEYYRSRMEKCAVAQWRRLDGWMKKRSFYDQTPTIDTMELLTEPDTAIAELVRREAKT